MAPSVVSRDPAVDLAGSRGALATGGVARRPRFESPAPARAVLRPHRRLHRRGPIPALLVRRSPRRHGSRRRRAARRPVRPSSSSARAHPRGRHHHRHARRHPVQLRRPSTTRARPLDRQVDVPKMRQGGLDVALLRRLRRPDAAHAGELRAGAASRRCEVRRHPPHGDGALPGPDRAGVHGRRRRADPSQRQAGRGIGIENGFVIGRDLSLLQKYHELGARYMSLTHNGHNDLADSWQPDPASATAASSTTA
jgi:hypothetical protein